MDTFTLPARLPWPGPGPRPRILIGFCCQGGEAMGYWQAGFDITGVDINPQLRFPFTFVQGDAIAYAREHGHEYAAVAGGPPCQGYSLTHRIHGNDHPRLIAQFREVVARLGKPYVIENVEEARAELRDAVLLCGAMAGFGLHTYRHRLFETNWPLTVPDHPEHGDPMVKMGRPLQPGDWYHAVGNFSGVPYVRADMGVPWMNRDGIRECIPPVYARHIGTQLLAHLAATAAAAA
ncbi:DNA methylase [Amycolatopsis sp. NBC_00438]|uniref:DNA methylase n=1 Tax=Amycolatopsis sp. NBC_00438 TaxID=2903558 RepID=UPI002E1E3399